MPRRMSEVRPAVLLFLQALAVYLLLGADHMFSVDGIVMYQQSKRLWFDGAFRFDPPLRFDSIELSFSRWDPGLSLAYVPFVAAFASAFPEDESFREIPAGKRALYADPSFRWVGVLNPLATAATVALLYGLARQLGTGPRRARWIAVAYGFASPWPVAGTADRYVLLRIAGPRRTVRRPRGHGSGRAARRASPGRTGRSTRSCRRRRRCGPAAACAGSA